MRVVDTTISVDSTQREQWIDITTYLRKFTEKNGCQTGILTISSLHTTAAITINENGDPDVESDIFTKLQKLIPYKESYYQHFEGNSDSHLKCSLVGISETLHIQQGSLILGQWQSVYFCEFDGPRFNRQIKATYIGV